MRNYLHKAVAFYNKKGKKKLAGLEITGEVIAKNTPLLIIPAYFWLYFRLCQIKI